MVNLELKIQKDLDKNVNSYLKIIRIIYKLSEYAKQKQNKRVTTSDFVSMPWYVNGQWNNSEYTCEYKYVYVYIKI